MGERRTNTLIVISMLTLALLVIAGCSTSTGPTGEVVEEETGPVKIGFIAPLTGDLSFLGQNIAKGLEMGVEEINRAGGVNGRSVELILEDGKCNAKEAAIAAHKLVNVDEVVAIVGGVCSSETLAAAPIAEGKTVMISPASSNPAITDAGDYIFRDYPSDVFQGAYAAEFAYNELGARRVATLYCLSDWCVALNNRFKQEFNELGGEIVIEESFDQGSKDLRTQLTKIKNANPDIIYFLSYTESGVVGLQQAKELGITTKIIGGDAWTDQTIPQRAGSASDGALFVEVYTPISNEFRARMEAFTGSDEVTVGTPQSYDALRILVGVMRKVGTNPEDIKNALYKVKYEGISGEIVFDSNGDLKTPRYIVKEYRNGKAVEYKG